MAVLLWCSRHLAQCLFASSVLYSHMFSFYVSTVVCLCGVCVCSCAGVYACVHTMYGSQRLTLVIFHCCSPFFFFFFLNLELIIWLRWPANEFQGSTCLCLTSSSVATKAHWDAWLSAWMLEYLTCQCSAIGADTSQLLETCIYRVLFLFFLACHPKCVHIPSALWDPEEPTALTVLSPWWGQQSRENNGRTLRVIFNLYTVMAHVTSNNAFGQNLLHANSVANTLGKQNLTMGIPSD